MIIHQTSSDSYVIYAVVPLTVNHTIVDMAMKNRTLLKIVWRGGRRLRWGGVIELSVRILSPRNGA